MHHNSKASISKFQRDMRDIRLEFDVGGKFINSYLATHIPKNLPLPLPEGKGKKTGEQILIQMCIIIRL
jgi:hypothetical protein